MWKKATQFSGTFFNTKMHTALQNSMKNVIHNIRVFPYLHVLSCCILHQYSNSFIITFSKITVFHHVFRYQSDKISNCSHSTRSYLHKTVLYAMSLPRLMSLLDQYIFKKLIFYIYTHYFLKQDRLGFIFYACHGINSPFVWGDWKNCGMKIYELFTKKSYL
jgi:hypothetical protein